jgi:hypothetical protein
MKPSGVLVIALVLFLLHTPAHALVVMMAGDHDLLPNMPGQVVQITISTNADDVTTKLDAHLSIGDQSGVGHPLMTDVNLLSGTAFELSNTGQIVEYDTGAQYYATVTSDPNVDLGKGNGYIPLALSSRAASVTLDTTGLQSGTWDFRLMFVGFPPGSWRYSSTEVYPPVNHQLLHGTLTIVPEPASLAMGLLAVAGLAAVAIRRARQA